MKAKHAMGTPPGASMQASFKELEYYNSSKAEFENRDKEAYQRMMARPKFDAFGFFKFFFGLYKDSRPSKDLPTVSPVMTDFLKPSMEGKIIWLGHSSFLLNLDSKMILVDPVFSDYASPVVFTVKRFQKMPIQLKDLPPIDYILISHDHYDHLDVSVVEFFREKSTKFIVPLGISSHLETWGVPKSKIKELGWWEAYEDQHVQFVATPAQHYSGRSTDDKNKTLWAGWVINRNKHRVFYSGDSGYDTHFKAIGKKYGPFEIAILDSGQYNPDWREVHLLPEDVIRAFEDINAETLFPVHWGAFQLAIHPWNEPAQKVFEYSKKKNHSVIIPKIGEIFKANKNYKTLPWWEL